MSSNISELKLSDAIKTDRHSQRTPEFQDCTPCRLIGSAAFTGLGVYTWLSGTAQLQQNKAEILRKGGPMSFALRRGGIGATAVGLIGLGFYRLINE